MSEHTPLPKWLRAWCKEYRKASNFAESIDSNGFADPPIASIAFAGATGRLGAMRAILVLDLLSADEQRNPHTLEFWPDHDSECPSNWGSFKVIPFSRSFIGNQNPDEAWANHADGIAAGTVFPLQYHEHGQCRWSLGGGPGPTHPKSAGVAGCAGLLVAVNIKTPNDPEQLHRDAVGFIEAYTHWCNGNVYGLTLTDCHGEEVELCGGFYGDEDAEEAALSAIKRLGLDPAEVKVTGDLSWIMD